MRNRFDEQLELLNVELIRMGALCEDAISYASRTLMREGDFTNEVYKTDREIDQKERDIENLCMRILLQQQPVAKDLRQVSSALKMISDMERIGDQASDIAEICSFLQGRETESRIHIRDMAEATMKMVTESIDSFVKKDLNIAKEVILYDDVVDELFGKVKQVYAVGQKNAVGCWNHVASSLTFENGVQATAEGIRLINEAAPSEAVIKIKAMEAFSAAANGKATKIIIPSEIQGVAGLASGLVEAVKGDVKSEE